MQDSNAANSHAASWTAEQIRAAWNQGQIAGKLNPDKWRKDAFGAWIAWQHFGNKNSSYGWEIDAAMAENGAAAEESPLRPLQWNNASAKQNGQSLCAVTAYGGENIRLR